MSIAKISIIVGASVITAGSTAAVATRDKWWPKKETSSEEEEGQKDTGTNNVAQPQSTGTGVGP